MQHTEILKTLEKLIPEGSKNGPEPTLLKYASDSNLAPAQLERLAQMYNVAMTINFMDKSANRGDSFQVIDVDSLLAKFTEPKMASPNRAAETVPEDWKGWFDNSQEVKQASTPDNFLEYARGNVQREKQANEVEFKEEYEEYESFMPAGFWEDLHKEAADAFEADALNQIISDTEDTFRNAAESVIDRVRMGESYSNLVTNACSAYGNAGASVSDAFAKYASSKGIDLGDYSTEKRYKIYEDPHGVVSLFKEAFDALTLRNSTLAYKEAADAEKQTIEEAVKTQPGHASGNILEERKRQQGGPGNTFPKEAPKGNKGGKGDKDDKDKKNDKWTKELINAVKPPPEDSIMPDKDEQKAIGNMIGAGAGAAGATFNPETYFGAIEKLDPEGRIKKMAPKKNKGQILMDRTMQEAATESTVQRLMLTDPIISKADPDLVIELVNTLAAGSPQIVSDPNLLSMALREAIQYEAIPLHTFKDIVEMEKNKWQGMKDQQTALDNIYEL